MIKKSRKGLFVKIVQACFLILVILMTISSAYSAEVKNENVSQVGNRVLFEFDVEGDSNEYTEVNLTITIKGETYSSDKLHLEGDYGKTRAGKGKKIYWNVLLDFPRGLNTTYDWDLLAGKDSTIGMELVFVKGGCYQMGDTFGDGDSDEKPVHEVCIKDFYIGKYDVTQGQWEAIMGNNPSWFNHCGDNCPVEQVSWHEAQDFINKLNQRTGNNYRLPTEAEWEYAARSGGKKERYAGTNGSVFDHLSSYAWYTDNSGSMTHPVGQKKPNALGLYDMSGNVWQWVQDWYDKYYYKSSPINHPTGPNSGSFRVIRGGSYIYVDRYVRAALRDNETPNYKNESLGLRLARTP